MNNITESSESADKILILSQGHEDFVSHLKNKLIEDHADIQVRVQDDNYESYDVCFFIDPVDILPSDVPNEKDRKFIFIFFGENTSASTFSSYARDLGFTNVKVILIQSSDEHIKKDIETLLWFCFSRTKDNFLHIYHTPHVIVTPNPVRRRKQIHLSFNEFKKPKFLIGIGIIFIVVTHLMFIPPLIDATMRHYHAVNALTSGTTNNLSFDLEKADDSLQLATSLYRFPKATFNLFSAGLFVEDAFHINSSAHTVLTTILRMQKTAQELTGYMTIPNKNPDELKHMYDNKKQLFEDMRILDNEISYLKEKIPQWDRSKMVKTKLEEAHKWLSLASSLENQLDIFFGKNAEKKYLVLFANNMELRPGGGFIGSFAILKLKDYAITDLSIYDVYDADGQLTEQIDPPDPLVKHLNQTHWYLRDSAFSPDFTDNFLDAESFVEKELGESEFDGGILLTTSTIENMLQAMDKLYIPDYKETLTKDNFYLKTQLYAENEFFPGSTQKKNFLKSVLSQLILNISDSSLPKLLLMVEKSLNEKQLVIYSRDLKLQQFLEENYWAGKLLKPSCNDRDAKNCVLDFIYSFDANLGVNKANYYIQRPTTLSVKMNDAGTIESTLNIIYQNDSYIDVFPGGKYKNYFQVLLPPNSQVTSVQVEGKNLKEYEETNFSFKKVAFLLEVPPQSKRAVTISYRLPMTVIKGAGIYQLIFQKQVGAPNYDFSFKFAFPDSVKITNTNLSPLVKGQEINYNTSISSDKIFIIEFQKK